ncbi:MAG: hypothetical protein LBE16_09075 [Clostridiales Family XIII bacterium]|jgi:hypothetical protein|nr:hypothetical protein [Clostridiales Family XIII bacterium]
MKNENLFPLERNSYFFGKLLTEREYHSEQDYFNNKRRLLNAAIVGSGVVCGLTVTKTDGATIAVESGLALDGLGREIAVSELIVTRLSELDGFSGDIGLTPYVYLCAEYAETPIEPVHAMTAAAGAETRFSRVREGARLFLSYGEPEPFEIVRADRGEYRVENLEKKLERGAKERLYLARIRLVRWEEAYEIDEIEQVPFGQYAEILAAPNAPGSAEPAEGAPRSHGRHCRFAEPAPQPVVSFGTAEVKVPGGAKPGTLHYSDDIPHGLGLIPAAVTLGFSSGDASVFGDLGIFDDKADFDFAVKVSDDDGMFRIGIRVHSKFPATRILRFIWSAVSDPAKSGAGAPETPRVVVTPSSARLKSYETLRLTAEVHGLSDSEVFWSVREPNGGDITRDGAYTAPADPGVYTVVAQCSRFTGTALVAVTEQ